MEFVSFFVSKQMPSICTLLAEKFEDLTVLLSEQASLQVLSFPCDHSTRSL
jgi:hypothetical protein